jgi:hypothetical protein
LHAFVAPAFRRALWNQAVARLKAGATSPKIEFSRTLAEPVSLTSQAQKDFNTEDTQSTEKIF